MNDNIGMSYQKDDDKQSFPSFVNQCIELFKKRYGYEPQAMYIGKDLPEDMTFPIPHTQVDHILEGTCILYTVVRRRTPIRASERFPI